MSIYSLNTVTPGHIKHSSIVALWRWQHRQGRAITSSGRSKWRWSHERWRSHRWRSHRRRSHHHGWSHQWRRATWRQSEHVRGWRGRAERCRHVDGRRLWLGDGDHLVLRLLLLLRRHDGGDDLLLLLLLGLHERPLVAVDRLKQPSIDRVKQGAPRSRTTPVCHDH